MVPSIQSCDYCMVMQHTSAACLVTMHHLVMTCITSGRKTIENSLPVDTKVEAAHPAAVSPSDPIYMLLLTAVELATIFMKKFRL